MPIEPGSRPREVRTAWFIAALMLAALVYFVSQGGLLQQLLPADEETEATPGTNARKEFLERVTHYRRAVTLPFSISEMDEQSLSQAFGRLRSTAVNWVELRIPLWSPTARGLELNSFDLRRINRVADLAHRNLSGLSVALYFWDGSHLTTAPDIEATSSFLASYRDILLEVAEASTRADAITLDALFGAPSVSATDWVELISELRDVYPGSLEARMGKGQTPAAYLRQLDAAHLPVDSGAVRQLLETEPETRIFLFSAAEDRYASGIERWNPVIESLSDDTAPMQTVLTLAKRISGIGGFTLSNERAFKHCASDAKTGADIRQALRELRDYQMRQEFETKRHSLRSTSE